MLFRIKRMTFWLNWSFDLLIYPNPQFHHCANYSNYAMFTARDTINRKPLKLNWKYCGSAFQIRLDLGQVDTDGALSSWGIVSWHPVNLVWSWNLYKVGDFFRCSLSTGRVLKDKSVGLKSAQNIHTSESILVDGKAGFRAGEKKHTFLKKV